MTDQPVEPDELELAAGFEPATREQWLAAVDAVVRRSGGIGPDDPLGAGVATLTRTTLEGIEVPPLYTADDVEGLVPSGVPGAWPFTRGGRAGGSVPHGWDVRQRHVGIDPAAVREAVLTDLDRGVTSVWLAVGDGGVPVEDLDGALEGVLLDLAPVALDAGALAVDAATSYLDLAAARGLADADLLGSLGLDPVGLRARDGDGPPVQDVLTTARRVAASFPRVTAVTVDATVVRDAGSSDAQQLGYSLSAGVAYLRALVDDGLDPAAAARLLEFRYAVSPQQFPTIALLRAARRCWARVLEACGSTGVPQRQHAVVSVAGYSRRDPWVNILRGAVAGFAAGVGGADSVTVPPFDAVLGVPEAFSRRVARNTQVLLIEEAHLARVIDPAGGSWYVERLTDDLARVAWEFFQRLEAEGGAVAALDGGVVGEAVAEVRARREQAAAHRTAPLTGVSEFADLDELSLRRTPLPGAGPARGGLPVFRPAAVFEDLRDRADAALARTGTRPTAFLATIGPLATSTARAGFTRNLLHAGGVATVEAGATDDVEQVVAAYAATPSRVAVLCSSDALYDDRAVQVVARLREAGAVRVLLAGRPRELAEVDGFLFAGCDAVAALADVHTALEVTQ